MKKFFTAAMKRLHIIKHHNGWVIWKAGQLVVPDIYPSKEAAILYARAHDPKDDLIVHRDDGTVERVERGLPAR